MQKPLEAVLFDLGGVLIDWDPRYLYRKIFAEQAAMEHFLATVCTQEWNEEQDAGSRSPRACACSPSSTHISRPRSPPIICAGRRC